MIAATDIRPGDVLHFFGEAHMVDRLEPRNDGATVARDALGWGFPLFPGNQWPTTPDHVWVSRPGGAA